ncbi:MAG: signal peptidase II, partial [Schaalia hyovaginalis]
MESRTKRAKGVGASRGMILAALVAVFAVITDQLTKAWALSALVEGRRIGVIGEHLSLVLTRNSGAAFSLGASST